MISFRKLYLKFRGNLLRLCGKIYECVAVLYTFMFRGIEPDPTKILIDNFTEMQVKAQREIDEIVQKKVAASGQLLILIPFRDKWEWTLKCLESLKNQNLPESISLATVLINNRSVDPLTLAELKGVNDRFPNLNITFFDANYDFNYSKINNDAFLARKSEAIKWVLFLNNDIELVDRNIVSKMLLVLDKVPTSCAIGSVLRYPDNRVQHLFAVPGAKIIASHPLKGRFIDAQCEWFSKLYRPVPSVTGAVLMVRADEFEAVGMFDEKLPTLGQDIILCLELQRKLHKYCVVVNSHEVIHHEGLTKLSIFPSKEVEYIYEKYGPILKWNHYYSFKFSKWSERPVYALPCEISYPVKMVIQSWSN